MIAAVSHQTGHPPSPIPRSRGLSFIRIAPAAAPPGLALVISLALPFPRPTPSSHELTEAPAATVGALPRATLTAVSALDSLYTELTQEGQVLLPARVLRERVRPSSARAAET